MIEAVLFDLDGVLVDACDWHYHALNEALEEIAGFKIERDEHESTFNGLPTYTKLHTLAVQGRVSPRDMNLIAELKQKKVKIVIAREAKHDAGKMSMHSMLKNDGLYIGCVTNSIRETTQMMLEKTGQISYMDVVVTNEDVSHPKPDPEGYIRAMAELGVSPDRVLIVEDSDKGYEAARESGGQVLRVRNATEVHWAKLRDLVR